MTSFSLAKGLPNMMYLNNCDPYCTQPSPLNNCDYKSQVVVSPPLTPSVSPLPSKIVSLRQNKISKKWETSGCRNSNGSTSSSTQFPVQQHKHVCRFQFCGWSFKRYEHLKRHMLVHTGERPHTCDFPSCGKSFSRSDNFHAHYRTHTKKKQPKKRAVTKHSVTNKSNGSQPKNISNSMASEVAANAAAMVAVSQQFGQNGNGEVYYNTNLYEMASFTDYIHSSAPFVGFDIPTSSPLSPISPPTSSLPLLSHEHQPTDFYFDLTNNEIRQSYPFTKNLLKSHTCPVVQCSRRFKRLEHLKRHMRIHTLEKPFCCTYSGCRKSFSRSDNLAQHAKTHSKQEDKRRRKQRS